MEVAQPCCMNLECIKESCECSLILCQCISPGSIAYVWHSVGNICSRSLIGLLILALGFDHVVALLRGSALRGGARLSRISWMGLRSTACEGVKGALTETCWKAP